MGDPNASGAQNQGSTQSQNPFQGGLGLSQSQWSQLSQSVQQVANTSDDADDDASEPSSPAPGPVPNCSAACLAMKNAGQWGGGAYVGTQPGVSPSGESGFVTITIVDGAGNIVGFGIYDASTGQYVGGYSPAPNKPFQPNSP